MAAFHKGPSRPNGPYGMAQPVGWVLNPRGPQDVMSRHRWAKPPRLPETPCIVTNGQVQSKKMEATMMRHNETQSGRCPPRKAIVYRAQRLDKDEP
jgi:hypothetical protein